MSGRAIERGDETPREVAAKLQERAGFTVQAGPGYSMVVDFDKLESLLDERDADIARIRVETPGPFAIHNMPCAICREKPAVLDLDRGVMEPCWSCQQLGYQTVKAPRWAKRLIRWWS